MNQYRESLIELVLEFLLQCKDIDGVKQISIIGSLISNKKKPKDVDLLLNITNDLELNYLAKISRKLQGKTGGITGGADIFLADLNNEYLGRICIWKDCRPGVRIRCDALNCGKRKYLHDDLETIKLMKELIDKPALVLFPKLIKNEIIPDDVEIGIIDKLYKNAR